MRNFPIFTRFIFDKGWYQTLTLVFFLLLLINVSPVFAGDTVLEEYIQTGLQSNLALKQKQFSLEKSLAALDEARGLYWPSISIQSRYSRAGGGRLIEFPVGSIVNPIYQTLNEILVGLGQQPQPFPVLPDQTIPFLREKEQETRVRLIQPVFRPEIYYNDALYSGLKDIQELETTIYKRELVKQIKIAYFNYLRAWYVIDLFQETKQVLEENLRISEKLYSVQKVTRDAVYRAEAELSAMTQNIMEAENNLDLSRSYFNFLLNRPLEAEVIIDEGILTVTKYDFPLDTARVLALTKREELNQMESAIGVTRNKRNIARSSFAPGLSAVVDYGYQGESYRFTPDDDYWMASLIFEWNLFRGFQDQARIEQATLETRQLQTRLEELRQQLQLEVRQAYNNFMLAQKTIEVSGQRVRSSESSFEIVNKKYQQGMAAMIEFLDARSNLTRAQINRIFANYDYHVSFAELERVTSYYNLNDVDKNDEE